MSGPFADAVKKAVAQGTDNWEVMYYMGATDAATGRCACSPRRLNVYMETRCSALGPEWSEWRRTIMRIKHEIRYA